MWDVVVGNPPFSKNLHLKIIDKAVRHLTEDGVSCFIHPARWYIDPLYKYKKNCDRLKFKYIVDRLDDVKVIDNKTANNKFEILFNGELMISKIKYEPTGKHITGYNDIAQDAIDIILKYSLEQNLSNVDELKKSDGWRCQLLDIVPLGDRNHQKSDREYERNRIVSLFVPLKNNVFYDGKDETGKWWTETRAKNQYSKSVGTPFPHSIKFETEEEALNFQTSCNTNFYNNILYMFKLDMNTPLGFLPWMEDYSRPWTDEDYCEFFGRLGMSRECQKWMCRDVYDYRVKDYIDYLDLP